MRHHTNEISRVVFHHTASDPDRTSIQDIYKWHVEENGWDAIGYHFVITNLGLTEYTRPMMYQGAHCSGRNDGSIGVAIVGDNTKDSWRWNRDQVGSMLKLWMNLNAVYPRLEAFGHRDLKDSTLCPGLDIRAMLYGPNAPRRE